MKILMTGASSFTGHFFARALADAGHAVVAVFTRESLDAYADDVRRERAARTLEKCDAIFGCRFGDAAFIEHLTTGSFDLLCHHGAEVTNYRSDDFDVARAVENNTHNAAQVVNAIARSGKGALLLTGTFFEAGEGAGSDAAFHFSPYGLSKSLSGELLRYYCQRSQIRLGKFVIPNPIGPWDNPRFTDYLVRSWVTGETPTIRTPDYIRDNIHASLLALAYTRFAERLDNSAQMYVRCSPSGYIESQGAFAERFAVEMRPRLSLPCEIRLAEQTEFPEPRIRINTEPAAAWAGQWDERAAWDEMAGYYQRHVVAGSGRKFAVQV
jgi:UDP-glucose 4-epimerase